MPTNGDIRPEPKPEAEQTNKNLAESYSTESREVLARLQRHFYTIFENSGDAMLVIYNGQFIDCNQAAVELMRGSSKADLLVNPDLLSPETQPDGRLSSEKAQEMIGTALQQGYHRFEWVHRRLDGSDFWAEVSLTTIDLDGDPVIFTIWRDVTTRKQSEAERAQMQQQVIQAQQAVLKELSTPLIPVMDRVLIMPLVGNISTSRAQDITRALLQGIGQYRAKVIIIDITGVRLVDSVVAGYLNKAIQAARLKGARTIITGISDAVAETVIDLGIDWSALETLSDLQSGLLAAVRYLDQPSA